MRVFNYVYKFTITTIICLILVGCSNKKEVTKVYDEEFITSLAKGLEDRWKIVDSYGNEEESKKYYINLIDKETKQVSKYSNVKFKNSELQQLAITYINNLKSQKKSLDYYGSDEFENKYSSVRNNRNETLLKINSIKKIKISSQYQSDWDEIKGEGKLEKDKTDKQNKINTLIKNIKFDIKERDEFGEFTTYTSETLNDTGYKMKSFGAIVKLKDESGTVVDTQYLNANDWDKNEKVKFEFMTDKPFKTYEVRESYIS